MVGAKLAGLSVGANQHSAIALPSQREAAEMLNIGESTVTATPEAGEDGSEKPVRLLRHSRTGIYSC